MQKIIILQGIPGSGKSTWARNFIKDKSESYIIVCRDDIRNMLGDYWVPKRENLVSEIEMDCITAGLKLGYNIIIDATNFNPKTKEKFEITFSAYNIEYKFFDVSLEEAIERDNKRERKVGADIITYFYNTYVKK